MISTAKLFVHVSLSSPPTRFFGNDKRLVEVRNSSSCVWPSTHRDALTFPSAVQDYISNEISLGRVAEPFAAPPFHDGFLVSPLNTVVKRDSNERRVIVDLSWLCGSLVYDGIPSGYFFRELLELIYPTIDAIASATALLGWGCMLYKRDLRKAHCQFPIYPYDYHLLGYTWNGQFYFDTVLTMGLRSAACQRSPSAVTWILNRRGLKIFNYLDDFIGASPPPTKSQSLRWARADVGMLLLILVCPKSVS